MLSNKLRMGGGGGGGITPGYYSIIASTGNNDSADPNIINIYYRRSLIHFVYTAAEIQAATGATSGTISALRFNVVGEPAYQPLPDYAVGIKNGTFSGDPGYTGYTIVFGPSAENFYANSEKFLGFGSNTFVWTGGDLAFAFAWGQCPEDYDESGVTPIGSGTMYFDQSDSSGAYTINSDSTGDYMNYRPVIELYFAG